MAAAVAWATVSSPLGDLGCAVTAAGVVALDLPGEDAPATRRRLLRAFDGDVAEDEAAVAPLAAELQAYFAGRLEAFATPVDWTLSTGFDRDVLQALAAVPYGVTISYGELAARVGDRGAARAVGRSLATNPVPIVVPCHRVIGADRSLTGFGGGVARIEQKASLLAVEGAILSLAPNTL